MRPLLAFLVAATVTSATAQAPVAGQTAEAFTGTASQPVALTYLLALPDGYADSDAPWPLVLFLHGSGERGDSLARIAVHGPPRLVREGQRFPFVLVSPQAPEGAWWDAHALGALLDDIEARYRIDRDRMYVTGLSMGGFGVWDLLSTFPDRFAAAAPVCGGGTPGRICAARATPVWAFHGALDTVVPLQRTREMTARLASCGGSVRFTVYPDAGHDAWTETYADPDLYTWLLSHRRGAAPQPDAGP